MVDGVAAIADGPELRRPARGARGPVARPRRSRVIAAPREKGVARRLRDVVRAGNEDFEKVYNSVFDFIANNGGGPRRVRAAGGAQCWRARPSAAAARASTSLPGRRAKPRFEAALKAVAALPFERRHGAPAVPQRTPASSKAVFKGDDFACCGVNDFVRARVAVLDVIGETNQFFVEIGFNSGSFEGGAGSNTYALWRRGVAGAAVR
ncbi:hypothetical protein JL721_9544 [Aureococcus anophagefferens]|nr:hypothetical protein JL721_9544 [Aureococcus anophagefferens]